LAIIDGADQSVGEINLAEVPWTDDDGTPRTAHASSLRDLPPPSSASFGAGWDGIDGLNARVVGPPPMSGGSLALSLVATKASGRHRLGLMLSGVPANIPVRAIAWVKVPEGARVSVDYRDGKLQGGEPANNGAALFDPAALKIISSSGSLKPSLARGPGDWQKLALDAIRSADGLLVIYVSLIGVSGNEVFSGEGQHMIFGGLELVPD
jgi:hypothetical protein